LAQKAKSPAAFGTQQSGNARAFFVEAAVIRWLLKNQLEIFVGELSASRLPCPMMRHYRTPAIGSPNQVAVSLLFSDNIQLAHDRESLFAMR
jgi:hypothetical protein